MKTEELPIDPVVKFNMSWFSLSVYGFCDEGGSAEYLRVLAHWKRLGQPEPIRTFILFWANEGSNISASEWRCQ